MKGSVPCNCLCFCQDRRHQLGSITDDSKADSEANERQPITDEQAAATRPRSPRLNTIDNINLDSSRLATLAMTSQSPEALLRLERSGFVHLVCQAVQDFCARQLASHMECLLGAERFTDASKSATSSPRTQPDADTVPDLSVDGTNSGGCQHLLDLHVHHDCKTVFLVSRQQHGARVVHHSA